MEKLSGKKASKQGVSFQGERFLVMHCEGALESLDEAMRHITPSKKVQSLRRNLDMQIARLASGDRMSGENFRTEGNLPKRPGQTSAKKFYALKKIPIRGYCWFSERHPGTIYISHYIYKDFDDLQAEDIDKVGRNWMKVELEHE